MDWLFRDRIETNILLKMAGRDSGEPEVRFFSPMPHGYHFVPKGGMCAELVLNAD